MKFILDSLDGLDEATAKLYKKRADGKFQLQVEGMPEPEDVEGLKKKVDELMDEKKEAKRLAAEAEKKAQDAADEAARKNGDTEALEKSWQAKYDKLEADKNGEISGLQSSINQMTVDSTASNLATELAIDGSADILLPHIKGRLAAEQRDGKFVTGVLDKDGKPSAATLDELKTEFANDSRFAAVIRASNASGGGANAGNNGGGGANAGNLGGTPAERQEAFRSKHPELAE